MTLISLVCFIIFTAMLLTFLVKGTDIFSPIRLFLMVWLLVIGITDLKLSRFQYQWSLYSWIVLLLAIFSFFVGMFVVYVINVDKRLKSIVEYRTAFKQTSLNTNKLFKITTILFLVYIVSYIVSYLIVGYIPLFTPRPDAVRARWGIFGAGLIIQSAPVIIYFSLLSLYFSRKRKIKRIILLFILLSIFITYFFLLQRFFLLFGLILFGVFIYYYTEKFNIRNVVIFLLFIILLLYTISSVRTSQWALNLLYYISQMKFSIKYAVFTEPYMYIAMNLENFSRAVDKLDTYTYGYYSFDFVWAISGLKHILAEYLSIKEFPFMITNNYNTYTSFFVYYRDFGVFGVGFIPFILGVVISSLYYRMRMEPDLNTISIYGAFVIVILFSFFIPIISWLIFVFNLMIIFLVTRYIGYNSLIRNVM